MRFWERLRRRRPTVGGVSIEPDEVERFELTDEDDEDLERAATERATDRLSPSYARLLRHMGESVTEVGAPRRLSSMETVEFLGVLPGGKWAWIGTSGTWGVIEAGAAELGGHTLRPGDVLRAKIEGWPWSYVISGIAPRTLTRDGARVSGPSASPIQRRGDGLDGLEVGDLIVAKIPYSPHSLPGGDGSTSKRRPAVFVGWSGDDALVRGIYTATKDRYIANHRSVPLLPEADLDHHSVAAGARTVEIPPHWIERRIGRLSATNRGRLGIGGTTRPTAEVAAVDEEPSLGLTASLTGYLESTLLRRKPGSWAELTRDVVRDIAAGRLMAAELREGRVLMSDIGNLLRAFGTRVPALGVRRGALVATVSDLLQRDPELSRLRLVKSDHAVPVDMLAMGVEDEAVADRQPVVVVEPFEPTWEGGPAVIICDQSWTHGHLGHRRIDLARLRDEVSGDGSPDAYLVGPCLGEVRAFHRAVERRGWIVVCAADRREEVEAARRIAAAAGDGPIIVVTNASDMVGELEADGHDVHVVNELGPFQM